MELRGSETILNIPLSGNLSVSSLSINSLISHSRCSKHHDIQTKSVRNSQPLGGHSHVFPRGPLSNVKGLSHARVTQSQHPRRYKESSGSSGGVHACRCSEQTSTRGKVNGEFHMSRTLMQKVKVLQDDCLLSVTPDPLLWVSESKRRYLV